MTVRPPARIAGAALAALAALLAAGCNDHMWWEYRDDPYLAAVSGMDGQEALREVNSLSPERRQMALRVVAYEAGRARRKGDAAKADRLVEIVVRRYSIEKDTSVRACIVALCAPAAGRGSGEMVAFLRGRIAAGEFPGYAAMSLAQLAPRGALEDITPLTRHPAPEIRFQAANALAVLADPGGYEHAVRVWRGMRTPQWPDRLEGVSLQDAKFALETRIERYFGKPPL